MTIDMIKLEFAANLIIEAIGEDVTDANFRDTPKRFAKAFSTLFHTESQIQHQLEGILKTSFPSKYNGMIFCKGIKTYSFCPHHLLPIAYDTTIGYIPSKEGLVIGASKLPRLVELFCKRAMLQEDLITIIADTIQKRLNPDGIAIVMRGEHGCMRIRGVKQQESTFEMSEMRGAFEQNQATRDEFFHLIMKG